MAAAAERAARLAKGLPPEVNRVLYVRNLPYGITPDELYELFGKYGAVKQIRLGSTKETRGTAYVVFEDIHDARSAHTHLQSFNVQGRYLLVAYHSAARLHKKLSLKEQEEALRELQRRAGVDGEQHAAARPAAAAAAAAGGGGGGGAGG
jgi:RNA recognition motif-containing protein